LERASAEARETAASHGRALAAGGAVRSDLERRLADASRRLVEGERQEAALLRQEAVLIERTTATAAERERARTAIAERASRIAALVADRTVVAETEATGAGHAAALESRLAELALAYERAAEESTNTRAAVDRLERRLGEAATRWEVLQRLHESGAGLHAGVRAVLAAGREDRLDGIVGTVAELLVVPEALETALEVALGSRLQDVVVARWVDAEAAITYLKRGGAGRATFQPLDTVRGDRAAALPLPLQDAAGIRGIAADLVSVSAEVRPVIAALLSRTLVVDDLETARAALPHLSPGWSVVTIDGEIARVGGSVTGGVAVRESGTLGRERELRELPAAVAGLETDLAGARERWDETEHAARAIADEQRKGQQEQAIARAAVVERQRQRDQLEAWLTDLHGEQARAESRLRELGAEQDRLADELRETRGQTRQVQRDRQQAEAARAEAERELTTHGAASSDLERAAADDGRRMAGLEERLRGERRREAGLHAQERALAEELKLRAERAAVLDRERESLVAELARLSHEVAASADELGDVVAPREPLRMEAMGAEIAVGRLAEATQTARAARAERERERDHAGFALERTRQDDAALRRRIVEELEVSHADEVLAWEPDEEAIPTVDREAEIVRLRERLRRVGYVGEDAVVEYEREAAQQKYLREQLADVEGAAAALRELLAELRQTMRTRFDETFAQVAEAFGEAFAVLFGGGSARLVLTTGNDGEEPGIDIIAQPPGKRLQSLAVLSGGERALTAAALLFAILKVNPAPFCLLDEVDAALDEANVVRFRECLQELAARSQVIVVTHNRGTIEIADTLYGVSMGVSGVSQVLSLRLSDSLPAD
jgi:chromosome segregation protein